MHTKNMSTGKLWLHKQKHEKIWWMLSGEEMEVCTETSSALKLS